MKSIILHLRNELQKQSYWQSIVRRVLIRTKRQVLFVVGAFLLLTSFTSNAQGPALNFDKYIAGMSGGQSEIVVQTGNGDVVIGKIDSFNHFQLIRIGNNGVVKLAKTYMGTDFTSTLTILVTADNGYLLGSKVDNGKSYQVL